MPEQFEPWFGAWPPECYGGKQNMEHDSLTFWGRLWRLSPALLPVGLGWGFSFWPDLAIPIQILLSTLGTTFFVIFILGLATDFWLKKAILDDAVRASLGYTLPEELKPAMRWVYTQHVICTKHVQTTEITHTSDPRTVIVRTRVIRTLENISGVTVTVDILLAADEWLEDGAHSEISEAAYCLDNQDKSLLKQQKRDACTIKIDKHQIRLKKGARVTIRQTWQEAKRATDSQFAFYIYPTQKPTVTVKAPSDIGIWATFYAGHDQSAIRLLGEGIFELDATLLPHQPIEVHWHEKDKSKKWMSEQDQGAPKGKTAKGTTREAPQSEPASASEERLQQP